MPARWLVLALVAAVVLVLVAACDDATGLPEAPGRYTLKEKSVTFDGERYAFYWAAPDGTLQRAQTSDVKLRLGDETYLEITEAREAILNLTQEEPVTVEGRDRGGDFGSFWYPFLIGSVLSQGSGPVVSDRPPPREYREPVYRYPPTGSFDRGDTIRGNVPSQRPEPPDYSRQSPAPGTVSGQSGGTGGGVAVTNRAESGRVTSGQAGGTGGGSAVLGKSGSFRSGDQSYTAKVERGEVRPITGGSGPRVGGGSGALTGDSSTKPKITTGRGSSSTTPRVTTGSSSPRRASPPRISTGRRR